VAACGLGAEVVTWDVSSRRVLRRFPCGSDQVTRLAFTCDGGRLLTVGWQGNLVAWDARTGQEVVRLESPTGPAPGRVTGPILPCLAASPVDAALVATRGMDGSVRVWDLERSVGLFRFDPGHGGVSRMAFTADGAALAAISADGDLRLWDLEDGGELAHEEVGFSWGGGLVECADGRRFAFGSGTAVRFCDPLGERPPDPGMHVGGVATMSVSPDGRTLATTGDGTIRLWDVASGKALRVLRSDAGAVQRGEWSADGGAVIALVSGGTVRSWDAGTWEEGPAHIVPIPKRTTTCLSADGTRLLGVEEGGGLRLWEVSSGRELERSEGHGVASWVGTAPDGAWYGVLDQQGRLRFYDASTLRELGWVEHPAHLTWGPVPSPDGRLIACPTSRQSLVVLEAATGEEVARCVAEGGTTSSVAFSPDGRSVAVGETSGRIAVFDAWTGRRVARLVGHEGASSVLSFTADGGRLLSGGHDGTVLVWDVRWLAEPSGERTIEAIASALSGEDAVAGREATDLLAGRAEASIALAVSLLAAAPRDLVRGEAAAGLPPGEALGRVRAIRLLERIGSPEALDALRRAERHGACARERRLAHEAVGRLEAAR